MHLVAPLAAGVSGAGNGSAEIYIRGTTTRAAYYSDFEGYGPVSSGASVVLDSNGGAEVYVNQLVDVIVRDSAGNSVRQFTAGDSAPNVEVRSASFSGVDYNNGTSATGYPTTLQVILDRWLDSAGATNFQVDIDGTPTDLSDAVASLGGIMFNVKGPTYGAVGDGVTDDTAAIASCIAAATAAGHSIVVFPQGTYNVTGLTIPENVSLWGFGATIRNTSAFGVTMTYGSATTSYKQLLKGLKFVTTSGLGNHISVTGAAALDIENCDFNQGTGAMVPIRINHVSADISLTRCELNVTVSATLVSAVAAKRLHISDCVFVYGSGAIAGPSVAVNTTTTDVMVSGCLFDLSLTTGASFDVMDLSPNNGSVMVIGNRFTDRATTVGTVNCITCLPAAEAAGLRVTEVGNVFGTDGGSAAPLAYGSMVARGKLLTRNTRQTSVTDAGSATLTLDSDQYGLIVVRQTSSGAAQTLNLDSTSAIASELLVVYHNDSAGVTGTITWGTGVRSSATTFTVNSNCASSFLFRRVTFNSVNYWVICGTSAANFAE